MTLSVDPSSRAGPGQAGQGDNPEDFLAAPIHITVAEKENHYFGACN